jgi:hypothetical protein
MHDNIIAAVKIFIKFFIEVCFIYPPPNPLPDIREGGKGGGLSLISKFTNPCYEV